MGKIKKKGTSGQAKNYITRTQAVRKLQISLPDFRKLCIFKGIYPREPRSHKKASKSSTQATTFYYTKDIQYLLHEPLLARFRERKALSKKVARLLGRNEVNDAVRLERNGAPRFTLDHIIRERYPTFVDALRDLDDALSLLFLFASLPSTSAVPPKVIARCQKLCQEFEHYLITTNSLRKSFLSIKGIYYQATIQGQDIMWLVPYQFVQKTTIDVDYRIMGTFVDFYCTLLSFVNFRLYTSIGLVYPPRFNADSDEQGAELGAFVLEGRNLGSSETENEPKAITNGQPVAVNPPDVQKQIDDVTKSADHPEELRTTLETQREKADDAIDVFQAAAPEADTLEQPALDQQQIAALFADTTFYISREAPRHPIEFILRAFGCKRIGWDPVLGSHAFTNDETDPRITHQVVDRPPLPESIATESTIKSDQSHDSISQVVRPGMRIPGRTYIQPQWIWDSINEGHLLRPDLYAPGATLPPHLSPWIKAAPGQYDPRATLAEQEPEGEAQQALEERRRLIDDTVTSNSATEGSNAASHHDDMVSQNSGSENEASTEGESEELDAFTGFDSDKVDEIDQRDVSEVEADDSDTQHQKELEAEAAGLPFSSDISVTKPSDKSATALGEKRAKIKRKEAEELERQLMMMSRKKRKVFEKMQFGNKKRDAEAEKLRSKRRKLEQSK